MKKETLEEAAEKYADIYRCPATNQDEYCKHDIISAFNNGAKWQQEQNKNLFSELVDLLEKYSYLFRKFMIMEKTILEEVLKMDYTELVPSKTLKSELILLTDDEFEKLRIHNKITDYEISENDYDTIIIGNKIFKKQNENMFNEEDVELIANEMVNWAIDNIGNPNPQSGKKFDEVLEKFKKK